MYKVIIIGAGFGGLSAAALLSSKGFDVTVLEKNSQAGGRAMIEHHKGFSFDMGPSWYLMPEVFEKLFNELGTSAKKELDLIRLNPGYCAFFGKQKLCVGNQEETKKLFESIEKGAGKKLDAYLKNSKYQYETAMNEFIYKEYKSVLDFLKFKLLKESLKINMFQSLHSSVKKQFKDKRLQKILEYSMVFLGGSPKNTPALYSLMSHVDITLGVYYPKGGLNAVAKAIERVAKRKGVKFKYNEEVISVDSKSGKIKGVKTKKNYYKADLVISNSDYAYFEQQILKDNQKSYSKKYWKTRTIAPSAYIMYLGVKKKLPMLNHHNLFLAENWEQHFDEIFEKPKWPTNPSYYVCNPSKTDNVAPKGHENLFFLVPVAPGLKDDEQTRLMMKEKILNHFQKTIKVNIEKNIVYEKIFAHKEFKEYYNSYKGTALGLTHTLFQTAIFRPSHKSKKIKGLYYTGHYTHPGIGVPMVIISSQILTQMIENEKRN